jgi:two-component system cell cycle sensor histidine kinase/response regulator CckA
VTAKNPSKNKNQVCGDRPDSAGEAKPARASDSSRTFDLLGAPPATELEARYQALLNSVQDAILLADSDTILDCNPAALDLLRGSREDIVGKRLRVFFASPEETAGLGPPDAPFDKVAESPREHARPFECWCRTVDGTFFCAEVGLSSLEAVGSRTLCAILRDVTDRKRAEQSLRESETRFRELFNHMNGAVAVYEAKNGGEDFIFLDFNRQGERIDNLRREDVIGKSVVDVFPGVRDFGLLGIFRRVWKTGKPERHPISHYEDRRISGWRDNYVYKLPTGEIVAVYEDVTERMQMIQALTESEQNFKALAENANDGILIAAPDGSHLYANPGAARITGFSESELLGIKMEQLAHPDHSRANRRHLNDRIRGTPAVGQYETVIVGRSGQPVTIEVSGARSTWQGQPVSIVIFRDITERRRLEEELCRTQKMEAVANLAGAVAHDFNNLLTAINGYSRMVRDALPADDPLRRDVGEIEKAGERAAELTRRLMTLGRPQILETRTLNLNGIIDGIETMLKPLLGENIRLVTVKSPDLGNVRANSGHMEQIIVNLAVNARDAMPDGGELRIETANVEIDPHNTATFGGLRPGPYVILRVSDTGTGMERDVLERVFEPFFTTKDKDTGRGLGLAVVYGMVRQYEGHVAIQSEVGKGTVLTIHLPRVNDPEDDGARERADAKPPRGSETILVIEDEETVRDLAVRILSNLGYTVLEAAEGDEALEIARRREPPIHLVLIDVVMPGMSGPQTLQELRKVRSGLKALFMSGYADSVLACHGTFNRETDLIAKPFTAEDLSKKIRAALDNAEDSL